MAAASPSRRAGSASATAAASASAAAAEIARGGVIYDATTGPTASAYTNGAVYGQTVKKRGGVGGESGVGLEGEAGEPLYLSGGGGDVDDNGVSVTARAAAAAAAAAGAAVASGGGDGGEGWLEEGDEMLPATVEVDEGTGIANAGVIGANVRAFCHPPTLYFMTGYIDSCFFVVVCVDVCLPDKHCCAYRSDGIIPESVFWG